MDKKEKILKWLKANQVYYAFYDNFIKKNYIPSLEPNDEFIEKAFSFKDTPEGEEFWKKINHQYKLWYKSVFNDNCYITPDDFVSVTKKYIFYGFSQSMDNKSVITIYARTVQEAIDSFHENFSHLYYTNIHMS